MVKLKISCVLPFSCSVYYEFRYSKLHNGFEKVNTWSIYVNVMQEDRFCPPPPSPGNSNYLLDKILCCRYSLHSSL